MPTRIIRRRGFRPMMRRRRKFQWQRVQRTVNVATPNVQEDLMASFKTAMGITLNLPELTIWRIRIKVSISIGFSPNALTSADGVMVSVWVDEFPQSTFLAAAAPYQEQYMLWDKLYASQTWQGAGVVGATPGNSVLYGDYDIKTRRVIKNLNESLFLGLSQQGNAIVNSYEFTANVLLKLP